MASNMKSLKRPAGSFGAMLGPFGGKSWHSRNGSSDEDKMVATLKAKEVRSSMAHFCQTSFGRSEVAYHGEIGLDPKASQNLGAATEASIGVKEVLLSGVDREEKVKNEAIDAEGPAASPECNDVDQLPVTSSDIEHPASENVRTLFPELSLPLSLSQMYRNKRHRKRGQKATSLDSRSNKLIGTPFLEQDSATESSGHSLTAAPGHPNHIDGPDIEPFDYATAKLNLGFKNGSESHHQKLTSSARSAKHPGLLKSQDHSRDADMSFDPTRRMRSSLKAYDFKPGKRRQVFPQSGNRTATFS